MQRFVRRARDDSTGQTAVGSAVERHAGQSADGMLAAGWKGWEQLVQSKNGIAGREKPSGNFQKSPEWAEDEQK